VQVQELHSQAEPAWVSLGQARAALERAQLARALNSQRSFEVPKLVGHVQAEPEQAANLPEQAAHSLA